MQITPEHFTAWGGVVAGVLAVGVIYGRITTKVDALTTSVQEIKNDLHFLSANLFKAAASCDRDDCPLYEVKPRGYSASPKFPIREIEE